MVVSLAQGVPRRPQIITRLSIHEYTKRLSDIQTSKWVRPPQLRAINKISLISFKLP